MAFHGTVFVHETIKGDAQRKPMDHSEPQRPGVGRRSCSSMEDARNIQRLHSTRSYCLRQGAGEVQTVATQTSCTLCFQPGGSRLSACRKNRARANKVHASTSMHDEFAAQQMFKVQMCAIHALVLSRLSKVLDHRYARFRFIIIAQCCTIADVIGNYINADILAHKVSRQSVVTLLLLVSSARASVSMSSKQLASVDVCVKQEVEEVEEEDSMQIIDESESVGDVELRILPNEPYATLPCGELFYGACTPWMEIFQSRSNLTVSIFFLNFTFHNNFLNVLLQSFARVKKKKFI
jgi:putative hemolysin